MIVQFGGQTPLKLAVPLQRRRRAHPRHVARRHRSRRGPPALQRASSTSSGLRQAAGATARSLAEAQTIAGAIGYPVLVRPSYVLGGRAMQIVHDDQDLVRVHDARRCSVAPSIRSSSTSSSEDAIEIDVDAVWPTATRVVVGGVMEHIEKAGIHSGDAACALPPYSLGDDQVYALRAQTKALARALGVVGLINVQFAIRHDVVYVHRGQPARLPHGAASSPRPSACRWPRSPPAPCWATRIADAGRRGGARAAPHRRQGGGVPLHQVPGVDVVLGPEMKSTGEVMGIDLRLPQGLSQVAARRGLHACPPRARSSCPVKNARQARRLMPLAKPAGGASASRWWPPPAPPGSSSGTGMVGGDHRTRSATVTDPTSSTS